MEPNLNRERKKSHYHQEASMSHHAIEVAEKIAREKMIEQGHKTSEIKAIKAFQKYTDFIIPHIPMTHGVVLLEDNGLKEIQHAPGSPIETSMGTLFKNTPFIFYPTRWYYLPDTQEIVMYRAHHLDEFPQEDKPFRGFEDYRTYWPDNFSRIVEQHSYGEVYRPRFSTKEIMKVVVRIENQIPQDSSINSEQLEANRKKLQEELNQVEQEMFRAETKAAEPVKRRIRQLIEALSRRKKLDKDEVILLRSAAEDEAGSEVMHYLVVKDINIVTSPKIPRMKKGVYKNLKILDDPENNDYMFLMGAQHISQRIIKSITGRYLTSY